MKKKNLDVGGWWACHLPWQLYVALFYHLHRNEKQILADLQREIKYIHSNINFITDSIQKYFFVVTLTTSQKEYVNTYRNTYLKYMYSHVIVMLKLIFMIFFSFFYTNFNIMYICIF